MILYTPQNRYFPFLHEKCMEKWKEPCVRSVHIFLGSNYGGVIECDEELFEDNPEEYIRRDIEGSDVDTRRRAACDLVRSLSKAFESQMTAIFAQYVQVSHKLY
jgi:hypothetical protein